MRPYLANIRTDFIVEGNTSKEKWSGDGHLCHPGAQQKETLCPPSSHSVLPAGPPLAMLKPEGKVSLVDTAWRVSIWPRAVKRVDSESGGANGEAVTQLLVCVLSSIQE